MSRDQPSATSARAERDRVADALRARIDSGELRPGDSLPTQKALMDEFEVERGVVRKALALLKSEHRLADVGRGSPPTVAEPANHREGVPALTADVELAERLDVAFQATDVTLDVFGLTTETLNSAIAPTLMTIRAGRAAPHSVTCRIMVPSPEAHLALPLLIADPADPRPLQRLNRLIELHTRAFRHSMQYLGERGLVQNLSVEVRGVALTPTTKLYLLNGTEALTGFYEVVPNHVPAPAGGGQMDIYDVLGLNSRLFHHSAGPDSRDEHDAAFVDHSRKWFESMWTSIATPYHFG
ncbi:winged helix-turn-helix domain-containing protein [Streptomyces sp. NPDC004134]|uniref:winged helix-turn-helix domain-containing protein n=1 Tax=Streptomyces sp. NPDC004134 TaxID=3364691 RepID=UPI003691D905